MFTLHPQLAADTAAVADLSLSRLLLLRQHRHWPWLVLVPRRAEMREIIDLNAVDRDRLMQEIVGASALLQRLFKPDKLNVGALGNLVPQLHIHVIARFVGDPAWPGPVWGATPPLAYDEADLAALLQRLRDDLAAHPF